MIRTAPGARATARAHLDRSVGAVLLGCALLAGMLLTGLPLAREAFGAPAPQPTLLVDNGGRAAWSQQRRRPRIAFDAIVDENTRNTAVFSVDARGGDRACITCGTAVPAGFVGLMDWLPDGRHVLVSAENEHSQHRRFNQPAFGIDNDLWLVSVDGKRVERIWRAPGKGSAVLHARVSRRGDRVLFAERVPTGRPLPEALRRFGPGGEDQWAGWRLHVADIALRRSGEAVLRNHRVLQPNGPGFYEPSGFAPDGGLIYAFTPEGSRYSDDVWVTDRAGEHPRNLTRSPGTWDEQGAYTPDGRWFGFVSSRIAPQLVYPGADNAELVTDLFVQRRDGAPQRLTFFNAPSQAAAEAPARRHVVSFFGFSPDGRKALVRVAPQDRMRHSQLWLVDLPR